ncbi:MAG: metallophosphoesterase [Candidatus Lokiarchaeota archaeon]|nr:metallophosphoesterase [Candidatus Lokiarchaeota archaeon]
MVKIVHMADTHLGYRARRGTINKWAIPNYSRPYEQEIYDNFLKVMEDVSSVKNLDFLVHCGDMFHHPFLYSSYPPPEPARRTFEEGLKIFFRNTNGQVPFIYIEGNHGIFRGYEYTPFESHIKEEEYPNLYYFKERDLINAIKEYKALELNFPAKNTRFYLFPYFEFKGFDIYQQQYDNWIEKQRPPKNDGFTNIALAHGSAGDDTLHSKVNSDDLGFDYVALGHEHGLKQLSKNHFFSGSLLPMNFKEVYEKQGYLIVDIDDKTKNLNVEKVFTDQLFKRRFEIIQIVVNPNQSSTDLQNKILSELDVFINDSGFDPRTAARLKFNFTGEITFEKNWQINELMSSIRRDCFSELEKYNILQFIWKVVDISESLEDDISAGRIQDYILEKPDEEFKTFVNEKLNEEQSNYNIDKLTQIGMRALKKALRTIEREKEV